MVMVIRLSTIRAARHAPRGGEEGRSRRRRNEAGAPAKVVLFPGVRYEYLGTDVRRRADEGGTRLSPGRAAGMPEGD